MDNTDKAVTINILDWLEEDTKQELQQEKEKSYQNIRTEYIKLKTVAVSEMYRAIEDINENRDNCFVALGKAHLCYRLGLISKKAYSEIRDYLKRKARDQEDWKMLYEDLRQHYQRELMESEYWSTEYQNVSSKLDDLRKQQGNQF
jgi:hypothetical protein